MGATVGDLDQCGQVSMKSLHRLQMSRPSVNGGAVCYSPRLRGRVEQTVVRPPRRPSAVGDCGSGPVLLQSSLERNETALKGQPFLKWAGGKQWLAEVLRRVNNSSRGRYYEPFLGGGAAFFALRPQDASLSDNNEELIHAYRVVQQHPEELQQLLRTFKFSRSSYYALRAYRPRADLQRAARFIFLNRTCWNGLYRVNREGRFNVPFGEFAHPPDFADPVRLLSASAALQSVRLRACDFEQAVTDAREGDVVYFDPPYTVAHGHNGFLRYNESIFSWRDQIRLAAVFRRLAERGCHCILSNADHPSILRLYSRFHVVRLSRPSRIAASPSRRRGVTELLVSNFHFQVNR